MTWVLKIEEVCDRKVIRRQKVMTIDRPSSIKTVDDIGLRSDDAKQLLSAVQQFVSTCQFTRDAELRSTCAGCGKHQTIKDYRPRCVDTLYGRITDRCPRFTCSQCGLAPLPKLGRSTAEFDEVRAKLAAFLPFRVASNVLTTLLPADSGVTHTTIRNKTAQVAAALERSEGICSENGKSPKAAELTLGLDTAFVRSTTPAVARHHGVLVGCVERQQDRRYFAAIQRKTTQATTTIRSQLDLSGYHQSTNLTVLTDGAKGLRNLARRAVDASVTPILDWFHIAMRLQHMRQKARGLSTRVPTHREAKKIIQDELEKLRWRLWHGRVASVEQFQRKLSWAIRRFRFHNKPHRKDPQGFRTLWAMLLELKAYVCNNEVVIPNYHRRHHAGQRVSTSLVESAVNSLVNQRMNKQRQMRWTERGIQNVLRVRMALLNGEFETRTTTDHLFEHNTRKLSLAA